VNNEMLFDYGPWVAIAIWLTQQIWQQYQAWQGRRWKKSDQSDDMVVSLYERLIEQQRDTLTIIDRNTDALNAVKEAVDQVRVAFEQEIPELISSVRALTGRVARMEERLEK